MNRDLPRVDREKRRLEQEIQFARCVEFLVRMTEKYGDEVLEELAEGKVLEKQE